MKSFILILILFLITVNSVAQQPYYVVKVNNNARFRKDCILSDKPKWGTCDYVWKIGSNETTTNSKSTYSIAPHVRANVNDNDSKPTDFGESVKLKMTYHPENLGGHTGTKELEINAGGIVKGGEEIEVVHHCGMHTNHMWVTPYIEVDDPVYIRNEDGNRVIPVGYTDRNKLKLHIDPCSFKNSNSLELQVFYDEMYHKVNSYEGTLKPGETIKIGYDDIFGTNYNENYLKHIGKTLKFKLIKTMIDGEKQGSNELHVLFYKEAPDFSVQTYTPACKQDGVFKYATITLKNRDDEVFVWDENVKSSICTWDVLDDNGSLNRFDSVERVEQGVYKLNWGATFTITQAKSIQLSSVTMVDSSVVNDEGFDYAKEVKPKIDEPKNVVIKEENKTKVDKASVTQFTPMRSYFGGYDDITTNQEKYQASIIISDYSENSEISGATLRYSKAGTLDENSKSTLVMPTTEQELDKEIKNKISEKCADDIINEKPDWKNYYCEHYFNEKFKPLKYGYYSAPKITKSDKIELSMSVVRLIVKLSDNKYRITSASPYFASETIAESSATETNGYSFCDITGLDEAFYNSWSKNVDLTSFTSYVPRINAENSFVLLEKNPPQKQHLSHIYLKDSNGSYEYQYQRDQESSITVVLIESQERDYKCVNRIGSCLLCIGYGKGEYYTMNFDSDLKFPVGGNVFTKLTVEGIYQQSVMNNYGKCVAVRTILKEDSYCIYATNSTNQKKWTLTSREVELLGIDNDFVYLKDTRDGHTYRLSFNDPDGEIYFELDRDAVFQQWLKEGKGFKEIEEAYKQFKIDEYKAHNIGYQLDVEGNTPYEVRLVDSDGCESDRINVEVKVPDNLLTHKIIKDPTDNCSKDGKVIISTIIKGIEFKVWKSGEDEQHVLKYDEQVEFDNLGMNDSIIEYRYSDPKDQKVKNGKYLIHFQHTSNIPKITEILPETNFGKGVIEIISNKPSDTYNVYKNTEKIYSSAYGKYISNLEQGSYYATINYKNEGCASPQSKVQVNYRTLKIEVKPTDAPSIGSNGSVTITAGLYNASSKDSNYSYLIRVYKKGSDKVSYSNNPKEGDKKGPGVGKDLDIKAIPVGDYVAKVWACDTEGNTYDGDAEEEDFSISQPHVNVGFISELNAKGEWTISAEGSPVDLKQISLHPCDILNRPILNTTIEFRNQLDKSKVYAILFKEKELVSKIKRPADINSPKPSYSNLSACSGKTVKCTYTFDEELSFEGSSNSQKSKSHVVQATSKSLSFDAVRHSYTVNKTSLLGSTASWTEIVTKTISDNNVPYVEKPSINWDDAIIKYNLDCYEQSTPILDLKGINGGSNSLTYSCDVYLNNLLLQSVIVKNKGNNLSNTISFDKAGDYTLMITNNGSCPNDVLQTTITISQPDPLTFDYAVTDELCQGAKNGSIQISNVNGGNYGESFSYALAWEWTHNDFFKSWYSEGSIDKIGEYLSDRHKNGLFGGYEVTVYDENKCSKTESIYVNRYYNPLVKEAIVDSVNCAGGSDGAITLNKIQTNGTFYKEHGSKNGKEYSEGEEYVSLASLVCAPYVDSLELSPLPVKSLKEVENLSAGTYNLHLTDSKGCESVATYTVYEPEKMKLNFLEDNLNLRIPKKGSTGGAVSLQVSGGNENSGYTLFVNDEPIGDMKLNTPKNLKNSFLAQDYFFYCKDNYHSCLSDSVHLSFIEPDEDLSFKKLVSNAKCKAEVGSIKITPSGGWGGYRYSGPDLKMGGYNETNYTFDKLKAGSYEITVFDEENVSYTEMVVVNEPEELRVGVMSDGSDCSGNGSAKLTITGGTPMPGNLYESYNVEKADTIMYGNEPLFENLRPDLYSFVTLDANGCKAVASFSIKDVSLKVVVDDWHYPTSSTSRDGWIRALASQGAGNYSYMWKHVESGNVVGTDSIAVNISPGTYWLEVSDGNCIASLQKILSSFDSRNLTIEELHRESGPDMNNGSVLLSCSDAIDSLSLAVIFNDSIVPYDSLKFVMENDGSSVRLSRLSPGYYSVACRNALSQGVEIAGFVIPKYISMELRMLSLHHQKTKRHLNGEAKFLLDGGVAPYNVTLNGEDVVMSGANIVLSNLKADTYSLVVEDSCHVTISRDFEIKAPNDLHFLYEVDSLTCFKSRDGRINLTPYGGWGDYQFSVNGNPFSNRQKYSNMLAGSYTIEVVDCYGATYWDSIYVHQPDSMEVVSLRQDSVSCRGLYDGSVAINVKGGNGVFSIQRDVDGDVWRRGLLYRNLPAMAGYLFNVRDYKGCRIDSIMQDVYEPAPMLLSPNVTHTTCGLNNGAISVNVSGGSFPYSYAWRENGNPMSERSNNISNLLQNGEYELTVVDYHECSERQSFRIDRSSLPYINRVQTDSVSCFGYNDGMAWVDSADVVYAYPKADYKLLWHDGQVGMSAGGLSQGEWSVRILDDNGCMTESPFRISQPTPLTIEKRLQRDALCYGYNDGALAVSPKGGNGGYSFSWSNGMNTPEADSLAAGSYTVLIKDVKNCEASESYVISEPEKLLVDAGEDVTICPGGSYTFIVPGYASYEWKNSRGEVVSSCESVKVSEEDTYSLSVTDVIGCYAHDDVRLRIGNDALKANFSMTSTATTCDTIAAVEMSNMTLDSLRWEYPSPEFERYPELESEAYVMDFKVTTPGIYEVTLWAYSGGCVSLNTKSIEVLEEDDSAEADPEVRAVPYILSFKVSPNPTDGLITVTAELRENMPALLKIYEVASGRMVQSRSLDGDSHYMAQFDLSSESQGLYLVTISAKNDKNNVKIIVK